MAKFDLGEIAIVGHVVNSEALKFVGMECEIIAVPSGQRRFLFGRNLNAGKYLVRVDGEYWGTFEDKLRKRPDGSQQRFRDTLKPCDKDFSDDLTTWLRPTETEVKEGLKGILQPFDNFYEGYDQ